MFASFPLWPIFAQQVSDRWSEMFFGMDEDQRFVLLIIVIGCTAAVICTVVGCVSGALISMHRRRLEHELKQDLLDRGMSADEVAQIVESSPPSGFLERAAANFGPRKRG
jgi:hypothetical protein